MDTRKNFLWMGLLVIVLLSLVGCASSLKEQLDVAAKTCPVPQDKDGDQIVAAAARVKGGPMEQSGLALQLYLKRGNPQMSYQRTTITPAATTQQPAASQPLAKSPRGKKALICPPETPKQQPSQIVVNEMGYYNQIEKLAGTANMLEGWLIGWGRAFLGNAPLAAGIATSGFGYPGTSIKMNANQTGAGSGPVTNTVTGTNTGTVTGTNTGTVTGTNTSTNTINP